MNTNAGFMMTRPDNLAPGTQVGHWRVVEQVGLGGQGAVYRVEDSLHPGDFYALKLSLYPRDARAERELVLVMNRAAHPQVVGFHGCVRWPHPREGYLGLVLDWVPGLALDRWAETGHTTFRQLAAVGATVARTLGELHERGVLHRDLKPEHIRVRASDGQPVLLDFGAGWYEGAAPLTTGPLPPATLYLLSPEAVRFLWKSPESPGTHYVSRATDDLYALGVCLYRATTGHYPYAEWMALEALQNAIVYAHPPAPVLVNPRVPRALSDVVMRLLEKEPSKRYPSGEALHEAVVAAARSEEALWDASIFEWEESAPQKQGEPAGGHIVLPARPRLSVPSSPPLAESASRGSHWRKRLVPAAAVLLVLASVLRLTLGVSGVGIPEERGATDVRMDSGRPPSEQAPPPMKEQKRAPCKQGLEVELSGACWFPHEQRPPDCPRETIAYKGKCLWPVPNLFLSFRPAWMAESPMPGEPAPQRPLCKDSIRLLQLPLRGPKCGSTLCGRGAKTTPQLGPRPCWTAPCPWAGSPDTASRCVPCTEPPRSGTLRAFSPSERAYSSTRPP